MARVAPRSSAQAIEFCREQDRTNTTRWYRMCQMLQRQARGLPAVYPTAASAQAATPASERVGLTGLKPGMVAFTKGSNPAGHIVLVDRWTSNVKRPENLLVWSNDMAADGKGVALVPLSRILNGWRHSFQFGATWLNGYDFSEFDKPATPARGTISKNYEHGLEDIEKAIKFHEKKGNTDLVKLMKRDRRLMLRTYEAIEQHKKDRKKK